MNKRSVDISSLVILLSLLSLMAEIFVYYFVPMHWVTAVFAAVLSLLITHFCLESALDYDYGFIHASFMMISTFAFALIVYLIQPNQWITYDYWLVLLVLINWMVPFIYNAIRDMYDRGPRFDGYRTFFYRMSVLFVLLFLFVAAKQYFITPIVPPYKEMAFGAHNFVPFYATSTYIETCLRAGKNLLALFLYIAEIFVIGIPIGFFGSIFLRKVWVGFRVFLYFVTPIILEVLQYATGCGRGDIDDVAFSLLGIFVGCILFHIMNAMSQAASNREFMMSRSAARQFTRS